MATGAESNAATLMWRRAVGLVLLGAASAILGAAA
jgi:hypothetical protein